MSYQTGSALLECHTPTLGKSSSTGSEIHEEVIAVAIWQERRTGSEERPQAPSLGRVTGEKSQVPGEGSADMSCQGTVQKTWEIMPEGGAVPDMPVCPAC